MFDPIALKLGPITIYWYGVMYLLGFIGAFVACYLRRQSQPSPWKLNEILDLFFYGSLGVIIGGTWGYWLLYDTSVLWTDPLQLFRFWEPGRSFHGGLLGVIVGVWLFTKQYHRSFWEVCDFIAPAAPIGIAAGRIGNFMNGELWGRVTDVPWAVVFPRVGDLPRHPSQLYEFLLEGVLLFMILQVLVQKKRPVGVASGAFLFGYGFFRFLVEFVREPDLQHGFIGFGWMTLGQIYSLPMLMLGIFLWVRPPNLWFKTKGAK